MLGRMPSLHPFFAPQAVIETASENTQTIAQSDAIDLIVQRGDTAFPVDDRGNIGLAEASPRDNVQAENAPDMRLRD